MKIEIVKIDKDGYNVARISDNENNFLEYMYNPDLSQWKGINGIINNTSVRNDIGWQKNSKGRLSQKSIEISDQLHEFFKNNINDINT